MASEHRVLVALPVPGLRPDSLGNYFASLGLFRTLARRWPNLRAAWNDGELNFVGGPESIDALLSAVCDVASRNGWMPYERGWASAQKERSRLKSGTPFALWQAMADEANLELFAAHVVPSGIGSFNPLLGNAGKKGQRDFSKGWKTAAVALADNSSKSHLDATGKRAELKALLLGDPITWMLKDLNAASWFSEANKLYNSGQRPFREGNLSPWLMVLACEGLPFFAGGVSRRLGARARGVGAFPFVTFSGAPRSAGEVGRDEAEVWAPLWARPMTAAEAVTLFSRGRAEVRGRGVLTPSAFATAVMRRGIDAGISEFRRFVLGKTTAKDYSEPRFEGRIQVRPATEPGAAISAVFERLLALVERLPQDKRKGKRWRFIGLRGAVEAAMLDVAEAPSDSESARDLLDAVVAALDRIDKNRPFRELRIAWEPLPLEWLPTVFNDEPPGAEARLALALVSSFPADRPFAVYRFGVELDRFCRFTHPPEIPKQWVWRSTAAASRLLSDVLFRRTLDWEGLYDEDEPVRLVLPATCAHVGSWLSGFADSELLARWISRLALFDWRTVPRSVKSLASHSSERGDVTGAVCLFGLLQPLFDLRPVPRSNDQAADLLPRESGARTAAVARRVLGLLRTRDVEATIQLATSRYAMAGTPLVRSAVPWSAGDPEVLAASLLFPVFDDERSALAKRWLRPRREQGGSAYEA